MNVYYILLKAAVYKSRETCDLVKKILGRFQKFGKFVNFVMHFKDKHNK